MATETLIQENIHLGLTHSSEVAIHCHHGSKHGIMQSDMVLERWLRVLRPYQQAAGRE